MYTFVCIVERKKMGIGLVVVAVAVVAVEINV